MILKYDVYCRVVNGSLEIYQLVPRRREWRIRLGPNDAQSVKELMARLINGVEEFEMQDFLEEKPSLCSEIVQFVREKNLLSQIDPTDKTENPFLRQLEVFDSWNSTQEKPQVFQEKLARSSVLVIGAGG